MTYEQLEKVNKELEGTDIGKGKKYALVNDRVRAFRKLFPNGKVCFVFPIAGIVAETDPHAGGKVMADMKFLIHCRKSPLLVYWYGFSLIHTHKAESFMAFSMPESRAPFVIFQPAKE